MPQREQRARDALASQGIRTPVDFALWARKRGLLSVYLIFTPRQGIYPARWQAVRPGHPTADGPGWQQGNKTFVAHSLGEKILAEEAVRAWASARFEVSNWVRVEGLGNALFPEPVALELQRDLPDLVLSRQRQHAKRASRSS